MVWFQHDLWTLLTLQWNEFCWQRNDLKIDSSAISGVRGSFRGGSAVGEQNDCWHYSVGINTFFWNECGGDEAADWSKTCPQRAGAAQTPPDEVSLSQHHVLTKHFAPDLPEQVFEGKREFGLCITFTFRTREKLKKLSSTKMFGSSSGSTSLFVGRR